MQHIYKHDTVWGTEDSKTPFEKSYQIKTNSAKVEARKDIKFTLKLGWENGEISFMKSLLLQGPKEISSLQMDNSF